MGVRCYPIVVLICISVVVLSIFHKLTGYSLEKWLFNYFVHFWITFSLILNFRSFVYILDINPLDECFADIFFSPSVGCFSILLIVSFVWVFNIREVLVNYFFILLPVPLVSYQEVIAKSHVVKVMPYFSLKFIVLGLIFRSLIYF